MSEQQVSERPAPPIALGQYVHANGPEVFAQGYVTSANAIGLTLVEADGLYFYPWSTLHWVKLNLPHPDVAPATRETTSAANLTPATNMTPAAQTDAEAVFGASESRWSRDRRNDLYTRGKRVGLVNAAMFKSDMALTLGHGEPFSDDEWDAYEIHVQRMEEAAAEAALARGNAAAATDVDLRTMPMPMNGQGRH